MISMQSSVLSGQGVDRQRIGFVGTLSVRMRREICRTRPGLRSILFACLLLVSAGMLHAQQRADSSAIGASERKALLDVARASAQAQLHKPVRFVVKQLRQVGGWVFLHANLLDARDRPISYANTPYAEADRRGQKSGGYDALLRLDHGRWTVQVDRIGATDVPWTNWSRDYGAPAALFVEAAGD